MTSTRIVTPRPAVKLVYHNNRYQLVEDKTHLSSDAYSIKLKKMANDCHVVKGDPKSITYVVFTPKGSPSSYVLPARFFFTQQPFNIDIDEPTMKRDLIAMGRVIENTLVHHNNSIPVITNNDHVFRSIEWFVYISIAIVVFSLFIAMLKQ